MNSKEEKRLMKELDEMLNDNLSMGVNKMNRNNNDTTITIKRDSKVRFDIFKAMNQCSADELLVMMMDKFEDKNAANSNATK